MANAFEEVVPASILSSTQTKKAPWDVFINHRGSDVKHTLASDIYDALDRLGLRVFLDKEELELGDFIPALLQDAMSSSFLHIAIFSPNYAQSAWCLAELSFMLKTGNRIIPVFYNVEPGVLRWVAEGKGIYAAALSALEAKGRYSSEMLQNWKMALQRVSYHDGLILENEKNEGRLLKSIVNHVLKYMKKVPLEVAKHPVGLDEAFYDFERSVLESSQSHCNVQIVGIVGMGGCGKTTLAKEIYNRISSSMEKCSFLFDVRDAAAKKDLFIKQKKLLQDLGFKNLLFDNVEEGKGVLTTRLKSLSLFIILDDVDHQDQLDALLPGIDSFAIGSIIIVTSRDMGVLTSWGISSIYKMKELGIEHAKKLLCWHAFLQPSPPERFEGLVQKFVEVCKGLPLSLTVFGGQLYKKPEDYWGSQLSKISRLLPKNIKERLKISYDALDNEEQQIFLDVACFFIGEKKDLAIAVWDSYGWSGVHSWETLVNKCLVELDEENCIKMHDQLRDLGKEIAISKSPYRLWLPEKLGNIQKQGRIRGIKARRYEFCEVANAPCSSHYQTPFLGCMELVRSSYRPSSVGLELFKEFANKNSEGNQERVLIRGIKAEIAVFDKDFPRACSSHHQTPFQEHMELARSSSRELRLSGPLEFLIVEGNYFTEDFATLSTGLVWLRWVSFPHKILPSWLSLKNLRVLELQDAGHLEELWRDNSDPPLELRELIITGGRRFQSFPRSIGRLMNLKKIVLHGGPYMPIGGSLLPDEFCLLQSVEHLELCGCLTELPIKFGDLTNLRYLDLSFCSELNMLPVSFKQLIHLEYIFLRGCGKLAITSENGDILDSMTKLEILNFTSCTSLQVLPSQRTNQRSLRKLYMINTGLRELPNNFGQLNKLEVLEIGSPCLKSLPTSFGNLSSLTTLEIYGCEELESLPDSIGNLFSLTTFEISHCQKLEYLPHSFGNLSSLTKLEIFGCLKLESLPDSIKSLNCLEHLKIKETGVKYLPKALSFGDRELAFQPGSSSSSSSSSSMCNLKIIELSYTCVSRISISQQCCPSLETLLLYCNYHLIQIEALPVSVKTIELMHCKMLKSISGISGLVHLQKLVIEECGELDELPSFAKLVLLKKIVISRCNKLELLPDSIGNLSSLSKLKIFRCWKLESLPESIRCLNRLERLKIRKTGVKYLPKSLSSGDMELAFLSGFSSSSMCNLKFIDLSHTCVSSISISQQCCPSLETLLLNNNDQLIQIGALPVSVKTIELMHCKMLKSISGIKGLVHLQKMVIWECGELDELPSFAELVSLKEFEIKENARECTKIHGLDHCRSLETLKARTSWKVAGIQSLKHTESLKRLELSACNISAIEPALQSIETQRWPSETMIWARSVRDMDSIVNSFALLSDLTLVDSFMEEMLLTLKCRQMLSSNAAAMVFFVINSKSGYIDLQLRTKNGEPCTSDIWLKEGKWVLVGVFTHASSLMAEEYQLHWRPTDVEVRGMLAMGERESVVKGFYKLLAHLGKSVSA